MKDGEACFSGQLALTLAQLRQRPEVLWSSTSKTEFLRQWRNNHPEGQVKERFLLSYGLSFYQELLQWKCTSGYHATLRRGEPLLSFPSFFLNPDPPHSLSGMSGKGGSHQDERGWRRRQPRPDWRPSLLCNLLEVKRPCRRADVEQLAWGFNCLFGFFPGFVCWSPQP